jgi:hypothetical protein
VDQSASDPTFLAFKVRLLGALQRRDVPALIAAVDPKVRVSFGENLDRPAQSRIWSELAAVLRLGVTRDEAEFIAPYVFTRFPQTLDAYTHAAIIRLGVIVRRSPSAAYPKVAELDHALVQLSGGRRNGWVEIRTDEAAGWVRQEDVRSPLDYRAFFEKKNGSWKLTAFVSGD